MGVTTEQRLAGLDDRLKATKACYDTAGSLVKMYVIEMGEVEVTTSGVHNETFRFTPTYGMGHNNIITLSAVVKSFGEVRRSQALTQPQDGSGHIDIVVYNVENGETINIIASGTSPGTFSRIA